MIRKLIALSLIILLSPIYFIIAMIILVDDGFPIIYKQVNLGKNHIPFVLFKFRTMKKNTPLLPTEEMNNSDNYLLRSAHFLRKFSLDEIPQFFNVLNGTMNFIGPRPCLEKNESVIKNLREKYGIHEIRPGITGLAQVEGRDANSYERKVELDKKYFEKQNFIMDLKIIFQTFFVVIFPKNIKH